MDSIIIHIESMVGRLNEILVYLGKWISRVPLLVSKAFAGGKLYWLLLLFRYILVITLLSGVVIFLPPVIHSRIGPFSERISEADSVAGSSVKFSGFQKLENEVARLDKKLTRLTPKSPYMIINSAENEFRILRGDELLRKGRCSTGSFILLKNGDQQEWLFKTPKGEFKVRSKTRFPVWRKPDWAFIEEGIPVPPPNHSSRYEYGVLGEYALNLGDGYLIHGTLYQRFLGLPVTHGCVRLNDEDLEFVYKSLNLGSKVYIY